MGVIDTKASHKCQWQHFALRPKPEIPPTPVHVNKGTHWGINRHWSITWQRKATSSCSMHCARALVTKCGGKECLLPFTSSSKTGNTPLQWGLQGVSQGGRRLGRGFRGLLLFYFFNIHFLLMHQAACLRFVHFLRVTL